jgi:hypothetical protein
METTQAKAEDKSASAAPATEAGQQPQPSLDNVSLADLDAVQTQAAQVKAAAGGGDEGKEAATTETPPAETPPAAVATETPPAAETPPAEEPKPAEPEEPSGEIPSRFRFQDPTDRAIAAVKKAADVNGTPITWAEAEKRVRGEPQAPVETPDPAAVASANIDTLKGEITELENKINPPDEGDVLSSKEMREAQVELARKSKDLLKAELQLESANSRVEAERQAAIAEQANAREQSKSRAIELYPDAADANTKLGAAIAQRFAEMKNPKHPDHPILYADTAPERITKDVAAELGIAPKSKAAPPATPPVATTPPAPPPKKATPVSGSKTAVPGTPAEANTGAKYQSVDELRDKGSLDELDAVQGGNVGLAAAIR